MTEHELITATTDNRNRIEKTQAKKWRTLSFSWSLFFYISYATALISCFICDLAINKGLTWFWIVLSALLLAFTFTNLPKHIKHYKLIFIPFSMYIALTLLLGFCCIYTGGDWFWVAILSGLFGLIAIFMPIYISKYKIFERIRNYTDFISVAIDYAALNILLIVIDAFSVSNGYASNHWFLKLGFPITLSCYLMLNVLLAVRLLKINKFLKTSLILLLIDSLYLLPPFLHFSNPTLQREIDNANIFKADFSRWIPNITLENNVHLIIALTLSGLAILFLLGGVVYTLQIEKRKHMFK